MKVLLVLAGLSVLSSAIEHRALWGYWWSRPSLVSAVEGAEEVTEFSILRFENRKIIPLQDRLQILEWLKSQQGPKDEPHGESRLLESLNIGQGSLGRLPTISQPILDGAWEKLISEGWLPRVQDTRYRDSGVPVRGLAVRFLKNKFDYLLIAFRTSEIENDRYSYSEALFSGLDSEPFLIKQVHYYYEIAGLEGIGYVVLLPINAALLFVCYMALRIVTVIASRSKSQPPANVIGL